MDRTRIPPPETVFCAHGNGACDRWILQTDDFACARCGRFVCNAHVSVVRVETGEFPNAARNVTICEGCVGGGEPDASEPQAAVGDAGPVSGASKSARKRGRRRRL